MLLKQPPYVLPGRFILLFYLFVHGCTREHIYMGGGCEGQKRISNLLKCELDTGGYEPHWCWESKSSPLARAVTAFNG